MTTTHLALEDNNLCPDPSNAGDDGTGTRSIERTPEKRSAVNADLRYLGRRLACSRTDRGGGDVIASPSGFAGYRYSPETVPGIEKRERTRRMTKKMEYSRKEPDRIPFVR
ncbi:hypothetical protein [Methanosphaerula subterraneus]|uniref:hypothetical protein n=1 Tax=Methanosphaerula subterraneus TaxID=3350244 RepID=UPI003F8433D8